MKKPTIPTAVIEEEDIEETATVGVPEIGETVNQEMKTGTRNLEKMHLPPTNDKPYRPPSARKHMNVVFTRSGLIYALPVKPNAKTIIIQDDSENEVDEAKKEVESSSSKRTKSDPPPLKSYKTKSRTLSAYAKKR
nr:hypothetical protein [Tanacetum cinerariifolium]